MPVDGEGAKVPCPRGPVPLTRVLWDELACFGRRDADSPPPETIPEVYRHIGQLPRDQSLSALCLSGGGIRSATFNLGVIQTLARIGLLGKFDYLSSVSGGGYIAAWLRAWMHRRGVDEVVRELGKGAKGSDPLNIEPKPLVNLR